VSTRPHRRREKGRIKFRELHLRNQKEENECREKQANLSYKGGGSGIGAGKEESGRTKEMHNHYKPEKNKYRVKIDEKGQGRR